MPVIILHRPSAWVALSLALHRIVRHKGDIILAASGTIDRNDMASGEPYLIEIPEGSYVAVAKDTPLYGYVYNDGTGVQLTSGTFIFYDYT